MTKRIITFVAAIAVMVLMQAPVLAQTNTAAGGGVNTACSTTNTAQLFTLRPWNACFDSGEVQITRLTDLWFIAYPIIENGIKIAAYVAVGLIIWGGIKYSKSQGNSSEITAARSVIINALVGLVIAVLSVAIIQLITSRFVEV